MVIQVHPNSVTSDTSFLLPFFLVLFTQDGQVSSCVVSDVRVENPFLNWYTGVERPSLRATNSEIRRVETEEDFSLVKEHYFVLSASILRDGTTPLCFRLDNTHSRTYVHVHTSLVYTRSQYIYIRVLRHNGIRYPLKI